MTPALRDACGAAIHVVTRDNKTLRAGRAFLFILQHTGWGWFARFMAWPPMVWGVELGYFVVARNRGLFARFMFRKE